MSDASDAGAPRQRSCKSVEEQARTLVERLGEKRDELAAALAGRALSVEVLVRPLGEPVRLGFAGEGFVTTLSPANPLSLGFSPDVVIQGTVEQILETLTMDEPRPENVHLPDPDVWPRYARVHRIVAPELRTII